MTNLLKYIFILPIFSLFAQVTPYESIEESTFSNDNYNRSDLFLEQDLIYGRSVTFEQGLEIICYQDKVKAEISGFNVLYTPLDLNNIPAGEYLVKLSKTGFAPIEFRINVSTDKRTSIIVNLKKHKSILKINGLPETSEVYVNNQKIDPLRGEISAGVNYLRINAFGYEAYTDTIQADGETDIVLTPLLIKKDFNLKKLILSRDTIWLNDSPSQKKITIFIYAEASGEGQLLIRRTSDNTIIRIIDLVFEKRKTYYDWDLNDFGKADEGIYSIQVSGTDFLNSAELESSISVQEGNQSVWRNNFTGFSGFLFSPTAETLPKGISQIQTSICSVFTVGSINNFFVPAIFSMRTSPIGGLELAFGGGLYTSHLQNETSFDFFLSGKYRFIDCEKSTGFSAAAGISLNYNGKTSAFGKIPSYDPFAGLSGLSLILPLQFRFEKIAFHLTPEFKISPSFPGISSEGFSSGSINLWNYFRAAVSVDLGFFSTALSVAIQSPSYIDSKNLWPMFLGLDLNTTPGKTGFSLSLYSGLRYVKNEAVKITSGFSAGFIF